MVVSGRPAVQRDFFGKKAEGWADPTVDNQRLTLISGTKSARQTSYVLLPDFGKYADTNGLQNKSKVGRWVIVDNQRLT